jgi:enoyl-CoA hydratase
MVSATENNDETDAVLIADEGSLGHITLNRPRALNSLTLDMIRATATAFRRWQTDPKITAVALTGAGDRGFCAGADIRALRQAVLDGDPLPRTFWREEYRLNALIARYPKPVVGIMDGIVMGGGIGLTAHASHRVATERLQAAMPEVGIGFAPDVGGTYLLSRSPGELGTHMALTGASIGAQDAVLCGISDVVIDHTQVNELIEGLRNGDIQSALAAVTARSRELPPAGTLTSARAWIDECYGASSVPGIIERLQTHGDPAARATADTIATRSPTSLAVTLRAIRLARDLPSLEACLDQEFRISCRFLTTPDFVEGIRAAVVDKDRNPRWVPESLSSLDERDVDRYFSDLGADELGLASA